MDIGDWITLAAILVALSLGLSSLFQTQRLQKRARKEKILNEILEWSLDIEKSATSRRRRERDELWNTHQKYVSSKARCDYMKRVASSCFTSLSNNLKNVIIQLEETERATEEALSNSSSRGKPNTDKLIPQEKRLREQVVVLTAEIACLKTKGIT